ncbi:MAG: carboxypeptidase-like regulatory domain-containing protein [Candidatus Neomarinimicrobiota bacterium]
MYKIHVLTKYNHSIRMLPATRYFLVVLLSILGMTTCERPSTPPGNQSELGSLTGMVLDQETELPIAGAAVTALKNAVAGITDSLGAFLLDNLALGTDTIMVTVASYDTQYSPISIFEGPQQVTVYLHLTDTTVIPNPTPGEWLLLGLESESISAIAVDPSNENVIYAGSRINYDADKFGGLFKSIDGGTSWDTLISGTIIRDIDIHPTNPQIIYVLGGGALVSKTTDGGQTWMAADSGLHVGQHYATPGVLAIDPLNPDTLYVGSSAIGGGYLFKSTNGGLSWKKIGQSDIVYGGVTALAIDPDNSDILYVGTDMAGAILRSTDGGKNWDRLDFPEVGIVYDLLVHPIYSTHVFAGTWRYGFYFSTNSGASWHQANSGLSDTSWVNKIFIASNKVYISANGGGNGTVYYSFQDSYYWIRLGKKSFEPGIYTANLSPRSNRLLIGAEGLYVLSDSVNHENNP